MKLDKLKISRSYENKAETISNMENVGIIDEAVAGILEHINKMKTRYYGTCDVCGADLIPVFFEDKEIVKEYGVEFKTGRKRIAVDYLQCPNCLKKYTVDDSLDKKWR